MSGSHQRAAARLRFGCSADETEPLPFANSNILRLHRHDGPYVGEIINANQAALPCPCFAARRWRNDLGACPWRKSEKAIGASVRLRTQFTHPVFAKNPVRRDAEAVSDRAMQLLLRHFTRTTFVAASFHDPRIFRQPNVQISALESIQ